MALVTTGVDELIDAVVVIVGFVVMLVPQNGSSTDDMLKPQGPSDSSTEMLLYKYKRLPSAPKSVSLTLLAFSHH